MILFVLLCHEEFILWNYLKTGKISLNAATQ